MHFQKANITTLPAVSNRILSCRTQLELYFGAISLDGLRAEKILRLRYFTVLLLKAVYHYNSLLLTDAIFIVYDITCIFGEICGRYYMRSLILLC